MEKDMNPNEALDSATGATLEALIDLLATEMGGPPRLDELTQVLAWAAETLGDEVHGVPAGPVLIKPKVRGGTSTGQSNPSRANDLNDSTIVDAADMLSDLANKVRDTTGAPPSLTDLIALLSRGMRQRRAIGLADVQPGDITELALSRARRSKRARRGDIIAIPAAHGGHHLAVVLDRNDFGTALGLFRGRHMARTVSTGRHPEIDPHPVYVDDEYIASGRWQVVGHNEELIASLWPASPEIYHQPNLGLGGPDIGPFGAAETPDGRFRQLSEQEAREIGLLDPAFSQTYLGQHFEQRLKARET